MSFQWKHYCGKCDLCGDCVATCGKALRISTLHRIIRDDSKCNHCEACSSICDNIQTEFLRDGEDDN